jgi:hypothetical protein
MALVIPGRTDRAIYGDLRIGGDLYVQDDLAITGDSTIGGTSATTGVTSGPSKVAVFHTATTLTSAQSGAHCVFDTAAGQLYTLPAAEEGLTFTFQVLVTATSLVHRVACATGDFLLGHFVQSTDGTFVNAYHAANGSTHLAWEGNGSTKGGMVGDWLRVVGRDTTQWFVYGMGQATGSEATPFVTS